MAERFGGRPSGLWDDTLTRVLADFAQAGWIAEQERAAIERAKQKR